MSVMNCNRKGCKSIMCNLYSSDFGYICWDCYKELLYLGKVGKDHTRQFMNRSLLNVEDYDTVEKYYENIFKVI